MRVGLSTELEGELLRLGSELKAAKGAGVVTTTPNPADIWRCADCQAFGQLMEALDGRALCLRCNSKHQQTLLSRFPNGSCCSTFSAQPNPRAAVLRGWWCDEFVAIEAEGRIVLGVDPGEVDQL